MEKFRIGRVHILPPVKGTCPVCAEKHTPNEPHRINSFWYQMRFRQDRKRFATWADATRHCDKRTLDALLINAEKGGIMDLRVQSNGNWISREERLPTKEDADMRGLVLVWHVYQGLMLTGWHQIADNRYFVYWQKTVEPPEDADRLMREWDEAMEAKYEKKP